jgi:hypothetical protein
MSLRNAFRRLLRKQPDSEPPDAEAAGLDLPEWMPQTFDPQAWAEYQARMQQTIQHLLALDVSPYYAESDVSDVH